MPGHLILVRPHTSLLDGPVIARYLQWVDIAATCSPSIQIMLATLSGEGR
ncbi:hypothetical protein GGI1_01007 [Acidithiobacillus sp. GGI-221]|nr:hypothetical protein GGI1_01007 [Acidithiobacillus sp. GGI-221]